MNFLESQNPSRSRAGQGFAPGHGDLASTLSCMTPEQLLVVAGADEVLAFGPDRPELSLANLIIYEPDQELAAEVTRAAPNLKPRVLTDDNQMAESLAGYLVYGSAEEVGVFTAERVAASRPGLAGEARRLIEQSLARAHCNSATLKQWNALWEEHLLRNVKRLLQVPDLTQCEGVLAGLPAVVVGAGPSLDQSLADLAGAGKRSLVLAAASALGPLARAGISAHIALALEAKDESRQLEGIAPGSTLFAAASSSHPSHFSSWRGAMGLFHLLDWLPGLTGSGRHLPNGGHATSAAFSLAVLWGCNPIILVGQDLAYTGGRIHAQGRPGGEDEALPELIEVPGRNGGMVQTSQSMLSYRLWYQEAAAFLKRKHPDIKIINASAAGVDLQGFANLTLEEALSGLPPAKDDLGLVAQALSRLPCPTRSHLAAGFSQARLQVKQAQAVLLGQGLAQAKLAAPSGSAAAHALFKVSASSAPSEAVSSLKQMDELLLSLWEALYD